MAAFFKSKTQRFAEDKETVPGPGHYDPKLPQDLHVSSTKAYLACSDAPRFPSPSKDASGRTGSVQATPSAAPFTASKRKSVAASHFLYASALASAKRGKGAMGADVHTSRRAIAQPQFQTPCHVRSISLPSLNEDGEVRGMSQADVEFAKVLSQVESDKTALLDEMKGLKDDISSKEKMMVEMKEEMERVQNALKESETKMQESNSTIEQLSQCKAELTYETNELKAMIEAKQRELEATTQQSQQDSKAMREEHAKEVDALRAELKQAQEKYDSLKGELEKTIEMYDVAMKDKGQLEEEKSKLEGELAAIQLKAQEEGAALKQQVLECQQVSH